MKSKGATAFDAAVIGGALEEMAAELAGRKPLGSGEAKTHHAGGRPTVLSDLVLARIAELRASGLGYGRIADALGIGKTTVRRVLRTPGSAEPCLNSQVPDERGRSHA